MTVLSSSPDLHGVITVGFPKSGCDVTCWEFNEMSCIDQREAVLPVSQEMS